MEKKSQLNRSGAIVGIAILAALLLAIQIGLAPALAQPPGASQHDATIVRGSDIRDYGCLAGPTGNCLVVYTDVSNAYAFSPQELCGGDSCFSRVEFRW